MSRWFVAVLYLLLLAGFGAGIWGSYRALYPARDLHRVTGMLEARVSETSILVRHEAVPGLMEAMPSMVFIAESPEIIDRAGLAPGDRVRLTVRGGQDALIVVDIQKIR